MLNIYLLRHGETAWNADGNRYCGTTDLPLTEKGLQQAASVSRQLGDVSFEAVYSSPLQRAVRTAEMASGGRTVITDKRLTEVDFGNWEGKTKEEFIAENETIWQKWLDDPLVNRAGGTGETGEAVIKRVDAFYHQLLAEYTAGNILVVGHNGINRIFLCHKLGMPLKNYRQFFLDNATITMFTMETNGQFQLKYLNSRIK